MKKIIYLFIAITVQSCDPRVTPGQFEGTININAKIVNPRDSIGINDTVRIQLQSGDTILYNGTKVNVTYGSNDGANCGITLRKIDKANAGSIGAATGSTTVAAIGYLNVAKSIYFQNNVSNVKAEYLFIPKSKGVFFLEQQNLGAIDANNGQYKLNFGWNYGNINRNHQMLIDSAGAGSNFNLFLQDHIANGYEIYGFKVN